MTAALLVLAALADTLTMLMLPAGAERNPLAAGSPLVAVVAKALLVALLLLVPLGRYARRVWLFGALAWAFGAVANVIVVLA